MSYVVWRERLEQLALDYRARVKQHDELRRIYDSHTGIALREVKRARAALLEHIEERDPYEVGT